jgi:membrane-bound lytic murein transglycosylase D
VKKELVKSKAKPKSSSHTVKSGDNLYNIAKRYGTSVAAIQKANGTKGAMIRPGQSLVIPR